MVTNVQWVHSTQTRKGRQTVSETADVYIYITANGKDANKKEYMGVRFFGEKFAEVFGDADRLDIGFFGHLMAIAHRNGEFTVYKSVKNPEIRVKVDDILAMDRDPSELCGRYLLHYDKVAKEAYIDLSRRVK